MQSEINKKSDTEIEITGSLAPDEVLTHRSAALKSLGSGLELPGFRKGHVPEHIVAEHAGEGKVWAEMAERALHAAYPTIIAEKSLRVVGRPRVTITKLAPGNPLEFKIETSVLPEITLPDYKKIASGIQEEKAAEVTDGEIKDTLTKLTENLKKQPGEALTELNDETVKKFGPFESLADFKTKLKENMQKEKGARAHEKRRIAILDAILAEAHIPLPELVVESELHKMLAQFKGDVERVGIGFEDYLKQIKKTTDDLHKEWRADAEKRARTQLLLNEIAQTEKITPDEKAVTHEVEHVLSHHKDADKTVVRIYVETILTNEKVFEFLEKQIAKS